MQVLVLGAGLQGAACAYDLLSPPDAVVTLADAQPVSLPPFLADTPPDRLLQIELDVRNEIAAAAAIRAHDVALSALPYYLNYEMAQLSVEGGTHFADLGGNTDIVERQKSLNAQAQKAGVSVVVDCGLAPGMANILAMDLIDRFDEVTNVNLYVGGLPQNPTPPLNYQIVYSLEGALDYYTTQAWIVRDGKPQHVEALSELEYITFPNPVGQLEAFHTAGGLSTMPWDFAGKVDRMEYKTLRYPGHVAYMKPVRELGLLGLEPVDVKGVSIVPRDVFVSLADRKLRKPEGRDLVALLVTASGTRGGVAGRVTHQLIDLYDEQHGLSAMMRTTGYSLSLTAQMLMDGRIGDRGVYTAYQVTPSRFYIDELRKRGIAVETTEGNE